MYLSTHLITPYFITPNGTLKRPEHLIAWWSRIFSFLIPNDKDHVQLRCLCRLFRDALKPPALWTTFPHPNYSTLNDLIDKLNNVYHTEDPKKAPKVVFVLEGSFHNSSTTTTSTTTTRVVIKYPLKIIGAGQSKTFLFGYSFKIHGIKEEGKEVELKDMTSSGAKEEGVHAYNGLSFLCDSMTFTKCGGEGVYVEKTKGRLINCVITQCAYSGMYSSTNALIEVEGNTSVDGNAANGGYGLNTSNNTSSIIHLHYPLTKESISTNNHGNGNWNDNNNNKGTIQTIFNSEEEETYSCLPQTSSQTSSHTSSQTSSKTVSTHYYVRNNRRYVIPFDYEYRRNVRGQWINRTLLDVFNTTFPYQPPHYHEQQLKRGRLFAYAQDGCTVLPANHLLQLGNIVCHIIHVHEPSILYPSLSILGQTNDICVIVKNASCPVHQCGRFYRNTAVSILTHDYGVGAGTGNTDKIDTTLRTVHRLDRVTSGIVLLAKNKKTARTLSDHIKKNELKKEYLALVIGNFNNINNINNNITKSSKCSSHKKRTKNGYVICDASLAHHPITKQVHVPEHGQETSNQGKGLRVKKALTYFRCLKVGWCAVQSDSNNKSVGQSSSSDKGVSQKSVSQNDKGGSVLCSLIHCLPVTGRTHQIRVHLQHLGYPIVNDPLYGTALVQHDNTHIQDITQDTQEDNILDKTENKDEDKEDKEDSELKLNEIVQEQRMVDESDEGDDKSDESGIVWEVDPGCSHCQNGMELTNDVNNEYGSGSLNDVREKRVGSAQQHTDYICLHAMAYYYPGTLNTGGGGGGEEGGEEGAGGRVGGWSWVCPLELTPEWATSILYNQSATTNDKKMKNNKEDAQLLWKSLQQAREKDR